MSDREEWTHARAEIDRLYSLLEKETARAEAWQRELGRTFFAYKKLRCAARSLIALYDQHSPYDPAGELDEKIQQLRRAMTNQ